MKNLISISLVILCAVFSLNAQFFIPNGKITKKDKDFIKVRWEPSTMDEWKLSKTQGYTVSLYSKSNGQRGSLIESIKVFPLAYSDWELFIPRVSPFRQQFYLGVRNQLYPEKLTDSDEKITSLYQDQTSEGLDSIMLGLIIYSSTYDFNLAKLSGLAASFRTKNIGDYEIEIVCGKYKHTVSARDKKQELPKLSGEWGDKVVKLSWPTKGFHDQYFGYIIDKSEDGFRYSMKDSLPYVNFSFGGKKENELDIEKIDSLDQNDKMYYFRLRGMDYFGDYSSIRSSITGSGAEQLTLSPYIVYADQTENNEAHLKWEIGQKQQKVIKDFTLYRTDTIGGSYEVAVQSIPATSREIKIPMTFTINYYRIEANPHKGKALSSMPVFVMGQDTIPPAIPEVLSALVDEKGIVNLTWKKNIEPDLWGYRVYIANFKEDEFSLLTANPILDTLFKDTVNLNLGLENIYYMIHAADKRNNMSAFTDTIRLSLPDILPPASPVLMQLTQKKDTVIVQWVNSPSKDLKLQHLYRREFEGDPSWIKVATFDSSYIKTSYEDVGLLYDHHYAYTMVAVDRSGLESLPDQYLDILLEKPKEKFIPFSKVNYSLDYKSKNVTLQWVVNNPELFKHVTVYRGTDKQKMGKYKIIDHPLTQLTDTFVPGTTIYYRLKPAFEGQKETYFSEYIEVVTTTETPLKGSKTGK